MANLISILVILSELVIALISVTTAVYAIGLPILRRRLRDYLFESGMRRQKLRRDLASGLHDKEFVKNVKSQIKAHEQKERKILDQMAFLSIKRAVIYPCVLFGLSIFFACLFIYIIAESGQTIDFVSLLIPTVFLFWGTYYLLRILGVVESLALVPEAVPRFKIILIPKEVRPDEEIDITVKLRNVGTEIARNITVFVYFPVGFKILECTGQNYVSTGTRPGLHVASFERDRLDVRVTGNIGRVLTRTTSTLGKHPVLVTLREEILKYEEETLEIEVKP